MLIQDASKMKNQTNQDIRDLNSMVRSVVQAAKTGLSNCYAKLPDQLPYTVKRNSQGTIHPKGYSLRYAAISQIGIARWLSYHADDRDTLMDLWPAIQVKLPQVTDLGNLALCIWAGAECKRADYEYCADILSRVWNCSADRCNAVELGWIVQACASVQDVSGVMPGEMPWILEQAHRRLMKLYQPQANLFQRHQKPGWKEAISRRIACFADQVYPILALTTYAKVFNDTQILHPATGAVEKICQYQGNLGQWWWHYDITGNKICEEYPVFSVHQDSMAPMSIRSFDTFTQQNHLNKVKLGLHWLFGANELSESLVHEKEGIIWRNIERTEPGKLSRRIRGLNCVMNMNRLHRFGKRSIFGYRLNYECRPYHLGWILYAWADWREEENG